MVIRKIPDRTGKAYVPKGKIPVNIISAKDTAEITPPMAILKA